MGETRRSIHYRLKLIFVKWPAVSHESWLFTWIFISSESSQEIDNDFICRLWPVPSRFTNHRCLSLAPPLCGWILYVFLPCLDVFLLLLPLKLTIPSVMIGCTSFLKLQTPGIKAERNAICHRQFLFLLLPELYFNVFF